MRRSLFVSLGVFTLAILLFILLWTRELEELDTELKDADLPPSPLPQKASSEAVDQSHESSVLTPPPADAGLPALVMAPDYWKRRMEGLRRLPTANPKQEATHPVACSQRSLMVTGLPRSGTTITGDITSALLPYEQMVHEPLNPSNVHHVFCNKFIPSFHHFPMAGQFVNISQEEDQAKYTDYMDGIFDACCPPTFSTLDGSIRHPKIVIKDPTQPSSAEWLQKTYGVKVLVVIRHPAAIINSWKGLGWGSRGFDTLVQRYNDWMSLYILPYWKRYQWDDNWLFSRHEDFCKDPVGRTLDFYNFAWDPNYVVPGEEGGRVTTLRWSAAEREVYLKDEVSGEVVLHRKEKEDIEELVTSRTKDSLPDKKHGYYVLTLNAQKQIDNWKRELSEEQIHMVKEGCREIWQMFYSEEDW